MRAIPVKELSEALRRRWVDLHQSCDPPLGPFLHPDFAVAVGNVRSGTEVGILTHGNDVVGFLPFQRHPLGIGGSTGGRLCDLAGALVAPGVAFRRREVMRAFDLRVLRLSNVDASDALLGSEVEHPVAAPHIDISGGFDAYRAASLSSGSSFVSQIERRERKLEREVGPLRFEWHTDSDEVFQTLARWKAAQRRATGTANVLELPWASDLMDHVRRSPKRGVTPVLSALWVDGVLAAAHFGIRTARVLHYWIPAYNVELSKYSPGLVTMLRVIRAASERGIERVDLGPGEERYKVRAATGATQRGSVTLARSPAAALMLHATDSARSWSKESPAGEPLRVAARTLQRGAYKARSIVGGVIRSIPPFRAQGDEGAVEALSTD